MRLIHLAGAATGIFLVASTVACGGGDDKKSESNAAATTAPSTAATPPIIPRRSSFLGVRATISVIGTASTRNGGNAGRKMNGHQRLVTTTSALRAASRALFTDCRATVLSGL